MRGTHAHKGTAGAEWVVRAAAAATAVAAMVMVGGGGAGGGGDARLLRRFARLRRLHR